MIDLTNNTTPYGLLTPEEQEHLDSWDGDIEFWDIEDWLHKPSRHRGHYRTFVVYRTIPKPEHVEWWDTRDGCGAMASYDSVDEAREDVRAFGGTIYYITTDLDGSNPTIEVEFDK